jgi:hypothetical protein
MDGILILKQHTILIRIISFLKTFKNTKLKSTPPPASPILLGIVISISLHLYYRATMYSNSVTYSIFQTSLLTLYLALLAKEIG